MAGEVKLRVDLQARDKMSSVLRSTQKSMASLTQELIKSGAAQTKLGAKVAMAIGTQRRYARVLVRSADSASKFGRALFSVKGAMGALGVAAAAKSFQSFATSGEQAANIATRFGQAIPRAAEALKDAQAATAGLVEATDLQRVFNRFARLGVSVKDTTRLLELATKASIDQGRGVLDVARVIESSLKGRTTGLVDIGVNLDKITGLTTAYADKTGVAVGELDEMDRRLRVALPAALQALGDQFDAVDIEDFALRMQQTTTSVGDALSDMQVAAAEAFVEMAESMGVGKSIKAVETDVEGLFEALETLDRRAQEAATMPIFSKEFWAPVASAFAVGELALVKTNMKWRDMDGAISDLKRKLDTLPASIREDMWQRFGGILGNSSEKARGLARDLMLVATASDFVTEVFSMAPGFGDTVRVGAETPATKKPKKPKKPRGGGRRRTKAPDTRFADLARLELLEAQLAVERTIGRVAKARAKFAAAELATKQKWRNTQDREIASRIQAAEIAKLVLVRDRDIAKARTDAADAMERANKAAAAALMESMAAFAEKQADAAAQLRENVQNYRDAMEQIREETIETAAFGIGEAFAGAADLLGELDAQLASMEDPNRYKRVIAGFNAVAANVGKAASSVTAMGEAASGSAQEIAHGVQAGLSVAGPAVATAIEGVKERAVFYGLLETALAVATAFTNPPEAIGHGIAAAMMFAIAGMSSSKPTASAAPAGGAVGGGGGGFSGGGGASGGGGSAEPSTIVVNLGEGMVFGRPQEIGRAIAEKVAAMGGSGMEATAF